ncbi:MAG: GerMN domain-containing protein [Candidatus Aminicenantes bacterium]|nr:GerMN domain-containing protein [Candidatus Aminicenantes bacterium]
MKEKQLYLLGLLALVLIVLTILFFTTGEGEKIKKEEPGISPEESTQLSTERPTQKITLFFLSEDDALLHAEEREIPATSSVVEAARRAINELLQGSQEGLISPFPSQVQLRELFISEEGIAYVDFSREISEAQPYGATSEMLAIYSIVNTLTYNFKEIKKVFLLVEGRERETLSGHVDLSRPFLPMSDLIATKN